MPSPRWKWRESINVEYDAFSPHLLSVTCETSDWTEGAKYQVQFFIQKETYLKSVGSSQEVT